MLLCKTFTNLLLSICVLGTGNKRCGLAHIRHAFYHLGIFSSIFSKLFSVFEVTLQHEIFLIFSKDMYTLTLDFSTTH